MSGPRTLRSFGGFSLWLLACLFAPLLLVAGLTIGVRDMGRDHGVPGVLIMILVGALLVPLLFLLAR